MYNMITTYILKLRYPIVNLRWLCIFAQISRNLGQMENLCLEYRSGVDWHDKLPRNTIGIWTCCEA